MTDEKKALRKTQLQCEARIFLATKVLCRDELLWEKTLCQNDYS